MDAEIEIKPRPKTRPEKKLKRKYKSILEATNDFEGLQKLAIDFKADLVGFLKHSPRYRKIAILLLFTSLSFGQSSIVAAGNETHTIGETFPIMQQVDTLVQVSLSVPKWDVPIEAPKPKPIKKKSLFEKLMDFIKNLINKQK